jgi:cobalamin synthase
VHLVAAVAVSWWLIGPWGPVMMLGALVAVVSWSAFMVGRLGGLTGDVLGSGVELGELAFLLAGASLAHRGLL